MVSARDRPPVVTGSESGRIARIVPYVGTGPRHAVASYACISYLYSSGAYRTRLAGPTNAALLVPLLISPPPSSRVASVPEGRTVAVKHMVADRLDDRLQQPDRLANLIA